MRRFLLPAVVALLAAVAGVGVAQPVGPSLPTDTQQQMSAEMPPLVPKTHSCTVTVMTHDFRNSYGAPYNGTYSPPAGCPGAWAKVVLTLTSTVAGTQFDRDVYVAIGKAVVLDGTTSEPCCTGNASTWTVQRDVTDISALLHERQPVQVELDNVNDSTYTGVYHTVVSLTFYRTDSRTPVGPHPDRVLPVSSTGKGGPMLSISHNGQRAGSSVVFPRNLDRLHAQVFADSHGPCEEFWWGDPGQCAGKPYREVAVYLDGQLAGAAPAYPGIYTGAGGPGLWEPIPAPRAWNLRPYDLDLTPFVGRLTDGRAHKFEIGILDMTLANGDFWATAANLQIWTAHSHGRTHGHLLSVTAPANPTDKVTDPTSQAVPYTFDSNHALTFKGDRVVEGRHIVTTVQEQMGESATQAVLVDEGNWNWTQSTTTVAGGHTTVVTQDATYGLTTDVLTTYDITDDGTTTTYVDHSLWDWNSYAQHMNTVDATGIVFNGVENNSYNYSDYDGVCYDRTLSSQAGEVTVDKDSRGCLSAPPQHQ
ncbi:MAG: hypothetical protein QOC82_1442 [Frankiaceae bacterium]|jgi:hypothetical protein|nr:hypothetical protein [Frankiaceae bacterium]